MPCAQPEGPAGTPDTSDAEEDRADTPCPQGPRTCRPPFHTPPQHNRQVQEPFEARSHRDHVNRAKRTEHPALLDPEVGERYRALITFMTKLGTEGVKQGWRRQVRYWTRQARRLEGKRQEWVGHMPAHILFLLGGIIAVTSP